MTIPFAALPEGTRVQVRRAGMPQDPALIGRAGVVISASPYREQSLAVVLDGEGTPRMFTPAELEVTDAPVLPPEVEAARRLRALP
jgi:hypothetical protein